MQTNFNINQLTLPNSLTKAAYETLQQGKLFFSLTHKSLNIRLTNFFVPERQQQIKGLQPEVLAKFREMLNKINETDWQDAQKGIYPHSLLFDGPWQEFLSHYLELWLNIPEIWQRLRQKHYQEFAPEIDTEGYPSYYLQNFHHQTDGYLSEQSANFYDFLVEILFNGTGDAMRRRILAPLKQDLAALGVRPKEIRILDIACGTGRALKSIRAAFPQASLFGVDLSPAYLRKANRLLTEIPGELPQLLQANAEELPYLDNYFHRTTCVFTFHELPAEVRQKVIEEAFRVTKPGGVFVICDSIQAADEPELLPMMENFAAMYHEPYYHNYLHDDLVERLEKAGFAMIATENHFVSKYWIAHKP